MQLRELREYCQRRGWEIVGEYVDTGWSGSKTGRPALNRCMDAARKRQIDCVVVWKLDRFGRSLVDCLNNIRILEDHGVGFIAVTQGLDTDQRNPASRFLLHVLGAAAEFERSLIRERTQAGRLRYQQSYKGGCKGASSVAGVGRQRLVEAGGSACWQRSDAWSNPTFTCSAVEASLKSSLKVSVYLSS